MAKAKKEDISWGNVANVTKLDGTKEMMFLDFPIDTNIIKIDIRQIGLRHYEVTVREKTTKTAQYMHETDIYEKSFMVRLKHMVDFLMQGVYKS